MRIFDFKKFYLSIFLILIPCFNSFSQKWINYSVATGLSNNCIKGIVEDDYGKIWVGTSEGINYFNGREWICYSTTKGNPLVNDCINTFEKDREGNLWIGTPQGFMKINPSEDLNNPAKWHNYNHSNTTGGLSGNYIISILEDNYGRIWFGTRKNGISVLDLTISSSEDPIINPHHWTRLYLDTNLVNFHVLDIQKDTSGNIWVCTLEGVYRFDPEELQIDFSIPDLHDVYTIFVDSRGNVWFGRVEHCVTRVNPSELHNLEVLPGGQGIDVIGEDSDGQLWLGTTNTNAGIFVIDPNCDLSKSNNWFQFTQEDGLASNFVKCIYQDSEGDMWIGTDGRGISRCDNSWINFELNYTNVSAIVEDNFNNILLGTEGDGLRTVNLYNNLFVNGNWQSIRKKEKGLASDYIYCLFIDDTDSLWIGTAPDPSQPEVYKGLNLVDPVNFDKWETFTCESPDSGLIDNTVNAIAQDMIRYLWFGSQNGLNRVHRDSIRIKKNWAKFDTSNGLLSNIIKSLFIDKQHIIWVGTSNGLNQKNLNDSLQHSWSYVDVLKGKEINTIYQDFEYNLWFGTKKNGAYQINPSLDLNLPSNWSVFTSDDGLASNNVRSIFQRDSNEYWFATASGLTRLRISENDSLWTIFDADDGPESISIWATFEDNRGDLWFGTVGKGVTRHRVETNPPETYITLKLDVTTADNVLLTFKGYDLNTLPQKLTYSYQFDDNGWSCFEPTEMVQIFGLTNGRHIFEVRAADLDGNIDPTPAKDVFYKINSIYGGKVELGDSIAYVRIYFPPGILEPGREGAKVDHVKKYQLIDSSLIVAAYNINIQSSTIPMDKPLIITFAILTNKSLDRNNIGIFRQDVTRWEEIGGTVNTIDDSLVITTAIYQSGIYAIRKARAKESPDTEINVQPRVFSPTGNGQGFGNCTNISFSLKKTCNVTVKIYNVAGRLKRVIEKNTTFLPGTNVVEWDGSDDDGNICPSGLYVVTIEAEGKVHTKTVVISNKYQ